MPRIIYMSSLSIDEVVQYLDERAARYGGSVSDMLNLTPTELWDSPNELMAFWEPRDLSHIYPQSEFPELAADWSNITAEKETINRPRGAEVMTPEEFDAAQLDAQLDGSVIDSQFTDDSPEFLADLMELVS